MAQDNSSLKRKRPGSNAVTQKLTDAERTVYEAIFNKGDMGMGTWEMQRETKVQDTLITKAIKTLKAKLLIKDVVNIQNKRKKHYMAVEFEPSNELTGGSWYSEGNLDKDFIESLKRQCRYFITKMKVATIEGIKDAIGNSGVLNVEVNTNQIEEILQALVLDNEITEVRSTETGDFARIRRGTKCYTCQTKGPPQVGAMASIPCGVCPRINDCTSDGIISPKTCVYYKKWLDF